MVLLFYRTRIDWFHWLAIENKQKEHCGTLLLFKLHQTLSLCNPDNPSHKSPDMPVLNPAQQAVFVFYSQENFRTNRYFFWRCPHTYL